MTAPEGRQRDPRRLLAVAAWIGVVASTVCLLSGVPFLLEEGTTDPDVAGLGYVAFAVLAIMGAVGLALSVTVLRLRHTRTQVAAVVGIVLGLGLFPIWSAGMSIVSEPLPDWVGALQLPVPLSVLGLSVVALVWTRRPVS